MTANRAYFFCGIGGSGMLPLALMLLESGAHVSGSDRSHDQGRTPEKFAYLAQRGVALFPQDGSGVRDSAVTVVISAAVENTVPDVEAAHRIGAPLVTRAELLSQLFNAAPQSIGVAGTSGKSTTTGMTGWILKVAGRDPTIVNGAVMKNFISPTALFASAVVGRSGLLVAEVDESDGSIAHYEPKVALVNNVALDHKSMDELRALFRAFVAKADTAVLNLDNPEAAALATNNAITYSLGGLPARLAAGRIVPTPDGISFEVREHGSGCAVALKVPGTHNVANALAAIGAARACDVSLEEAARALGDFTGIRRRLEVTGTANGITVIDDFAHNPDKIAATLATLHTFPGRLLLMFQPHGFRPLKLLKDGFIAAFSEGMRADDILVMPEPVYFGGTTEKSVSSGDIARGVEEKGRRATALTDRTACGETLLAAARPGDRIVVMGARDDSLSEFAAGLVTALGAKRG